MIASYDFEEHRLYITTDNKHIRLSAVEVAEIFFLLQGIMNHERRIFTV